MRVPSPPRDQPEPHASRLQRTAPAPPLGPLRHLHGPSRGVSAPRLLPLPHACSPPPRLLPLPLACSPLPQTTERKRRRSVNVGVPRR